MLINLLRALHRLGFNDATSQGKNPTQLRYTLRLSEVTKLYVNHIVPTVSCTFYLVFRHFLRTRQNCKFCTELSSVLPPMTGHTDAGSEMNCFVPLKV